MSSAPKPKIFIGSSVEGLSVAYAIQANLSHSADSVVWDQGVFALSETTIESLVNILDSCDFGIFVFSPDDVALIKGSQKKIIRDNVLFELGLFIGKLGRNRTFMVAPASSPKMRIPTDLLGITLGSYDATQLEDSPQPATAVFCNQVRIAIKKLGHLRQPVLQTTGSVDGQEIHESKPEVIAKKEESWVILYLDRKFDEALKLIKIDLATEKIEEDRFFLNVAIIVCDSKMAPTSGTQNLEAYLEDNKENVFAWRTVAYFYLLDLLFSKAEQVINKGLQMFVGDSGLIMHKADLLDRMGKQLEAIELLKPLIGQNEEMLDKYMEIIEEEGLKDEALPILREAFQANTYSEKAANYYARLSFENSNWKVALYIYHYLSTEYINSAYYKVMVGNSCLMLGFLDTALGFYSKAQAIYDENQSTDTFAIENKGNLYKRLELFDESKKLFFKAVETNKESSYSYMRLSEIVEAQKTERIEFESARKEGRIEAFSSLTESVKPE